MSLPNKPAAYDEDVVRWANEQAAFLRAGDVSRLDLEHLADEIEDVGKSEQRELMSRLAALLAHLLTCLHQPERRGASWRRTIRDQRAGVERRLKRTPSLKGLLADPEFQDDAWMDAITQAMKETGMERDAFPEACPWPMADVLTPDWTPEA